MVVSITAGRGTVQTSMPKPMFATRIQLNPVSDQYAVTNDGQRFIVAEPVREATERIHITVNWNAASQ
jgi:hypothetical protein